MDYKSLLEVVGQLRDVVQGWEASGEVDAIERDIVLDKLKSLYEQVRFDAGSSRPIIVAQEIDNEHKEIIDFTIDLNSREPEAEAAPPVRHRVDREKLRSLYDEAGKVSELRQAIGLNDRYLIVNELFGGDADAYQQAIERLEEFDNIEDAMLYIHDNFRWDKDNAATKTIVALLSRKLM